MTIFGPIANQKCVVNFQISGNFSDIFLLLISSLFPLESENVLCVISVLLNMLRFVLWPRIFSIWGLVHGHYKKYAFCYCWVEFSINVFICLFKHKPSSLKLS